MGKIIKINKQVDPKNQDSNTPNNEGEKSVEKSLRQAYFHSLKKLDDLLNEKMD